MENAKSRKFSKEDVRRFLVFLQSFTQKDRGKKGTLEVIKQLECVQLDPINVVHRNQHLVLHNRIADYKPSYLEELLYTDRRIFEYWCNEKSIIPIEDLPYFQYRMHNPSQFHSPFYERIKSKRKEMEKAISYVLSEIRKYGPLSAQDLERDERINNRTATNVLNLLWDCGDLMIHHVEGNRRYYDLAERICPSNVDAHVYSREEYEQFMIRKYMKAYKLIDTRHWRFGWLPLKASQRKAIVQRMIEDNELRPIEVAGVKCPYYVLEDHLPALENADMTVSEKVCFLAPLDNLLWNRRMISEIFDFQYSWEVYKVPEKRIYGYYTMPILHGTRLIGRIDPKLDRKEEKMIVNSLFLEEKCPDECLIDRLVAALQRFAEFHDVTNVRIEKAHPTKLKDLLMRRLQR